ncbi:MAG: GNAT family N-acetyltransferase [Oscillospiraceae bacterium]|nr:GNAT family N-acetyltransferase [Oscillospiraceae bacterium]
MQIKETPWEKRNLGVNSSVEFLIGNDDTPDTMKELGVCQHEYQVAHIAPGNVAALLYAQEQGFRIIEMNIHLKRSLENVEMPKIYKRYEKVLGYRYADEKDMEQVLAAVRSGDMFLTDKIALDPAFSTELSGHRYACWTEDVLARGAVTVIATYKDQPVGFEIYEESENKCTNFIGGVYPEFANKGLGFAPLYMELLSQKERGNRSVITGVSSNNIPVLKLHELLGYSVDAMSYALVKHL